MPKPPLPPEAEEFLRLPNPAVIATVRADGSPHSAATWYDWDGERLLVNMERTRKRLDHMRGDPRVALTVLGTNTWYRQLTLLGRAVEIVDDPDLEDIDRLSRRYTGQAFRRNADRVSAWIEIDSWYGWEGSTHWPR
jgi:PPOX class probable F420-dependent enzyme